MQLAAVFGIKSLPTVVLIKNGQIVDGFMGALPESAIREFLSRHLPALPPEHESASITTTAQSPDQAITDLRAAIAAAPDKPELSLELAKILMQTGDIEGAATELAALPANLSDDIRTKRLCSRLEFLRALEGAADTATLLRRLAPNAHDFEAQDLLGVRRVLEGELNTGLEAFLHILRTQRNWRDGQAKQRLLTAFNFIEDDDLVSQYRRKMAAVLF
jgi:putative thioredoxin